MLLSAAIPVPFPYHCITLSKSFDYFEASRDGSNRSNRAFIMATVEKGCELARHMFYVRLIKNKMMKKTLTIRDLGTWRGLRGFFTAMCVLSGTNH